MTQPFDPSYHVVIPFRGDDPQRQANLRVVLSHWLNKARAAVHVVDDGRDGPFIRHAAYNRGAQQAWAAPVIVFAEADMIVPPDQIREAVQLAAQRPGVVIPYTRYKAFSRTGRVRTRALHPWIFKLLPARRGFTATIALHNLVGGMLIGPVNVVSRETLELVGGWDEKLVGHGFDDLAMARAFEVCAGPPRYVQGTAWHLWHPKVRKFNLRSMWRYLAYCRINDPAVIRKLTRSAVTPPQKPLPHQQQKPTQHEPNLNPPGAPPYHVAP